MQRESKEILKTLADHPEAMTVDEVADELFKDVKRIVQLAETLAGRRYIKVDRDPGDRLRLKITGRGQRFMAKFPDFVVS